MAATYSEEGNTKEKKKKKNSRVVGLRVDSLVLDDVLEGKVHETALARVVALGNRAVHELLLRQRGERASRDRDGTLSRSSRRERPARAAAALQRAHANCGGGGDGRARGARVSEV